jgi:hypothetical protein
MRAVQEGFYQEPGVFHERSGRQTWHLAAAGVRVNMPETGNFRELSWLDAYRVLGCPENVIRVRFHWPPFRTEHVLVRIDALEEKIFRCTVIQQPEKEWRINIGGPGSR